MTAISYKETGDYERAITHLKRELEYAPEEPSPLYNLACVYAEMGRKKEALEWLRKAIEAYPDYREQARADKDFRKIRETKEFKKLVGE